MNGDTKRFRGILLPNLTAIRESTVRDGKKLTRTRMSEDLGIDYAFLWRIETGRNGAGYETAKAIAGYLGVSLSDLENSEVNHQVSA